jgi:hypothetical protein
MLELREEEIQNILAGQPHHPDDKEVLYASSGDEPWIAPLVQSERIKAVVAPLSNKIVFHTAVMATVTDDEIVHLQAQDLFHFLDGQLWNEQGTAQITTNDVPAICHEYMIRTASAIEPFREEGQNILLEALAYPAGSKGRGRFPNLHSDEFSANVTVKGNAMKFLVGGVSPQEQDFIEQFGNGLHSVFERALAEKFAIRPDWESRLRSFEIGDLIIFNKRLYHCSDAVAPTGQLAFNAYFK